MNETASGPFVTAALALLALLAAGAPAVQAAASSPIACDNAAAACTSCDEKASLRSEDIVPLSIGLATEACHSTTPCPSGWTCKNWTSYYDCGGTFCDYSPICDDLATKQWRERYRYCFNAQNDLCIQYQVSFYTVACDCP